MLTIHVALVADTGAVSTRGITRVAALDKQVTWDFGPLWGVLATVDPVFRRNQTNEHIEQLIIRNGKREFMDLGVWHPSSCTEP